MSKSFILGFIVGVALLVVAGVGASRLKQSDAGTFIEQEKAAKNNSEEEIPIAAYSTTDIFSLQRQAKNARHNKPLGKIEENSNVIEVTEAESWIERVPSLPVAESDAVIVGRVTEAQAFLSIDKTGIYSEFTVSIEEVLNDKSRFLLKVGGTLTAEREGGRVRFPSGHIQSYRLAGEGFLRVGRRYALFLKQNDETQDFLFLTGYELRGSGVTPVDKVTSHSIYKGLDESTFLGEIRNAITTGKRAIQ